MHSLRNSPGKLITVVLFLLLIPVNSSGDSEASLFQRYFTDRTLRIDFYHTGNAESELVTLDRIYDQGAWSGSTVNLIDTLNNGAYMVKVFDSKTNSLIFSRGFDSLFREYQTTGPAAEGIKRTFHESVLMPKPRAEFQWTIEHRDRAHQLQRIYSAVIDPEANTVIRDALIPDVTISAFHESGDPHSRVDVLYVADGYTVKETAKFEADCRRLMEVFFSVEPFSGMQSSFNIRGAFKASGDSDVSKPHYGEFRHSAVGSSFYSFGSPRYLLTEDNRSLRDVAAHAPYDALFILVNTSTYGGGGIYNLYATTAVDNIWTDYVFIHEFGHSFAGLADEYYSSSTAYDEEAFYPPGIEPIEPNITRLLGDPVPKWLPHVTAGEIPTPWNKEAYDTRDQEYQANRGKLNRRIAEAKQAGEPAEVIDELQAEANRLSREAAEHADGLLRSDPAHGQVGAFEGAGYCSHGVYRPELDCIMFSKGKKPFCRVCGKAVERAIRFHSGLPVE